MLRCFLPVGQGAFYLERFNFGDNRINVIYDCGSQTDIKILEGEIRSNFEKDEDIEIVFISHVDRDHINGLEYLIKHCNVKNIVFPYIREADKWLISLDYFCNADNPSTDNFIYRFINNPVDALRSLGSNARLYIVLEEGYNQNISYNSNYVLTINSGSNALKEISDIEMLQRIEWEYVPFNFRGKEKQQDFYGKLTLCLNEVGIPFSKDEINLIFQEWTNDDIRKATIKAYKQVKGSLNSNSMVLFSGIKNKRIVQRKIDLYCRCRFCDCFEHFNRCMKANGCLYTGDYEAKGKHKWNDLKNAYDKYWDYIGCVQIPHHGSHKNYNPEFASLNSYFVISAGCRNNYRHPSGLVIKDLILKNKYPLIVTEQHDSDILLEINI